MTVEWDHWQTLLAVFRYRKFSRAASALSLDPTTVGRRIKNMEKRLAYPLFFRQDGQLFPTTRCESLLVHLETASEALRVAELESATNQFSAVWRTLRVAAPLF